MGKPASGQEIAATVQTYQGALSLAADGQANQVYAVLGNGNVIFNATTGDIVGSFETLASGVDVAVDTISHRIYATDDDGLYDFFALDSFDPTAITGNLAPRDSLVTLGNTAYRVAVNPVTQIQYVLVNADVAVISSNTVTTTLDFAETAAAIAVDSVRNRLYVLGSIGPQGVVWAIDGSTNATIGTVNVGADAQDIAVNAVTNTIYLTGHTASISAIDGNTLTLTYQKIFLVDGEVLAVNSVTNKIYVGSEFGTLTQFDGALGLRDWTINATSVVTAVAVNETANLVYVNDILGTAVTIVNPVPTIAAGITLGGLSQTFDNTPKSVTVTTDPSGLPYTVTYNGSPGLNYGPGSYAVTATITDVRYSGNVSGTLTIAAAPLPLITMQPQSLTVNVGQDATFSALATSNLPEQFAWLYNGQGLVGASGPSFTIPNAQVANSGTYQVVVYSSAGHVDSNIVTLTVNPPGSAPAITTQPKDQTAAAGSAAVLWASASGSPAPQFQWSFNGTPIPGATSSFLTLSAVAAPSAGSYTVTASNSLGSSTSGAAMVTVSAAGSGAAPAISLQPQPQTVAVGGTVVFSASAAGPSAASLTAPASLEISAVPRASTAPAFQWFLNGLAIDGASDSEFVISSANASNNGSYSCLVTNPYGSVFTSAALLGVVQSANPGRLINLSCRALVGTGASQLIAGFVVGGQGTSGTEPLLVRSSGPALQPFNVPGFLPDPTLTLNSASAQIDGNAGWGGSASISAAAAAAGAFAWASPTSHDAALVESLPDGAYTAEVAGASGDAGVSLAEVYDLTPAGTYTSSSPRLINISARVMVGSGGNILIGGFVIGGSTSRTVLVRGSGPALKAFNVPGTLADPQLQLYRDNPDGSSTLLQSDTGWAGDPVIKSASASVGAFSWGTSATADSAVLVTLPPGAYSVHVFGSSGDTGVALVEVYDVP
ncbi:MAG TPA: immunoglobulin domain-containing protein [Opitutaceae bacterium]|nr:immunoglobulin domain-containing protein [Opitutaceae bacterium]